MGTFDQVVANTARQASDVTSPDAAVDDRRYVTTILECYVQLPHTPNRPNKNDRCLAMRLFKYSIVYLFALFSAILADHWLMVWWTA